MKDEPRLVEDRVVGVEAPHVVPMAGEVGMTLMVGEVAAVAAGQIVDNSHPKPAVEQQIDQMAADKAGPAGDDRDRFQFQAALRRLRRRTLK